MKFNVMKYERNQNKLTIVPAIFSGITSVGLLYPAMFTPIKYADGYGYDMEIIGRDMWRAAEHYRDGTEEENTEPSTI